MSIYHSAPRHRVSIQAVTLFSSQGGRPGLESQILVQEDRGIFILADGFGGPGPGLQAAKTACEAVKGFLFKEAGDQDATFPFELRTYFSLAGNVLFNSLLHANQKLMTLNQGKSVHEKGGAAVLAGYIDEGLLALANVGNCTAWLIREGRAFEMTEPRSYGRMLDPFQKDIPEDERIPLVALGISHDLEPEICEFRIQRGDWVFLHTEGLPWGFREKVFELHREQQTEIPMSNSLSQLCCQKVFDLLNETRFNSDISASLLVF